MTGHDLMITMQTMLSIFGGLAIVVAGISSITKMFSPFKELKSKVEEHDTIIQNMKTEIDNQTSMQKEICKTLLVMMNHEITGNSIDKLKERQDDLQKFLVDH